MEVGLASPTTLPRRMTVIRSATARTSRSLWVMKTIEVPPSFRDAHDLDQVVGLLRGEHRGGLVEDEHLGVADQRLDDLHALLDPDREVLDERVRRHLEAVALGDLLHLAPGAPSVEEPERAVSLVAEHRRSRRR